MFRKIIFSKGFVFFEFAIALPLLILLFCGLLEVSLKIFSLDKDQLADYVLESEAQYAMERITRELRVAKEIEIEHYTDQIDKIKIVYHAIDDDDGSDDDDGIEDKEDGNLFEYDIDPNDGLDNYTMFTSKDVWETQFFIPYEVNGTYKNINAKRQESGSLSNPITGKNFFGDTKINSLQFLGHEEDPTLKENVLHITLEMESLVTGHKIKLATAVFMPGCKVKGCPPNE